MTEKRDKRKWIARGSWAVADQGFFAVGSVLLNVLLARWLTPREYGAFAVGYALFLLLATLHTAFVTEPLLVFGAGKYSAQLRQYLQTLLRLHWYLTAAGSLSLIVAASVLYFSGVGPLAQALFGLGLAAPFSLLMWFARRSAYLLLKPRLAAFASAAYMLLIVAGLSALATLHLLSILAAMVTLGVTGAVAGFWLLHLLHAAARDTQAAALAGPVIADHWRYGRWACATSMLMWVPLNFFFVVLSVAVSFQASATLKALSNLALPLLQVNAALGSLLLPAMVLRNQDRELFGKLLRLSLALFASGALVYSIIVGALGHALVPLLYGGRYNSNTDLLWLLLLIPILDGATMVLSSALRSLQRPNRVFWAQLAVAAFVLAVGVPAAHSAGLWGAATVIVIADALGVIILGGGVLANLPARHVKPAQVINSLPYAPPHLRGEGLEVGLSTPATSHLTPLRLRRGEETDHSPVQTVDKLSLTSLFVKS